MKLVDSRVLGIQRFRQLLYVVGLTIFAEFLLESIVYCWIVAVTAPTPALRSILLGAYVALSTVPRIFGSAIMGVVSDRVGASKSLTLANAGRSLFAALATVLTVIYSGATPVLAVVLFVFVAACSTLNQLFMAGRAKVVQEYVETDLRGAASSLSMTVLTGLSIVAASLGPLMFEKLGLELCLSLILALLLAGTTVGVLSFRSATASVNSVPDRQNFFGAMIHGWKTCWHVPRLRFVLIGSVLYGVPMGVNNVALILLWVQTKGGSLTDYGVASALFGLGGLLGSVVAGRLTSRYQPHQVFAVSLLSLGATYGFLAWSPNLLISFGLMALSGLLFSLYAVAQSPILMNASPPELTGRVFSTTGAVAAFSSLIAAMLVSLILAAPDLSEAAVPIIVTISGLLTVCGGGLLLRRPAEEPPQNNLAPSTVDNRG